MNDLIRKHRVALLTIIILFIGVPMIFFFGPPPFWEDGGGRPGGRVIASVGDIPVSEEQFVSALNQAAQQQAFGGEPPTMRELDEAGTATLVLQQLINNALLTHQHRARGFRIESELADRQIREWDIFQDEQGRFDSRTYNHWVQTQAARGLNWNSLRQEIEDQIGREVHRNVVLAAANRVRESDIEQELLDNSRRITMRYAQVEPPVEVSEEEVAQHFEENQEFYRLPDQRIAEFLAIPLRPPVPNQATQAVQQVREGADFAETAQELLDAAPLEIGWLTEADRAMAHRRPAFDLEPGQISDPVHGPGGFYVYFIDDERVNEETGEREVEGRQLFFSASLPQEARETLVSQARAIREQAADPEDFQAAALAAGFELQRTPPFDTQTTELEGLPATDVLSFVRAASQLEAGEITEPVTAQANIYLAQVVDVQTGAIPTLEEVRDQVREDVIARKKQSPEYQQEVQNYAQRIRAQVNRLEDIAAQFPELDVDIRTSSPFTKQDYLFQEGIFLATPEVYEALAHRQPGTVAGPFSDFRGETYFVELLERIEPTEEDMEDWPEQREMIRERLQHIARMEFLDDYLLDLRERAPVNIQINDAAIIDILGRDGRAIDEVPADEAPGTLTS